MRAAAAAELGGIMRLRRRLRLRPGRAAAQTPSLHNIASVDPAGILAIRGCPLPGPARSTGRAPRDGAPPLDPTASLVLTWPASQPAM